MTICHGIPWYRNGADDHCPFIIEGWWLFFYPLSYLTLTLYLTLLDKKKNHKTDPLCLMVQLINFILFHLFILLKSISKSG